MLLHDSTKAAAADWADFLEPKPPKRKGKLAWHQDGSERLHCTMRLRQLRRFTSNWQRNGCNIENGTV